MKSITESRFELAEGPVWSVETQSLYWLDIFAGSVHGCGPANRHDIHEVPPPVGFLAQIDERTLVYGAKQELYTLDTLSGESRLLAALELESPAHRFNDGAVDRAGRLFFGTLRDGSDLLDGGLHRLNPNSETELIQRTVCSNGLDWSEDSDLAYFTDTGRNRIVVFDYDSASGDMTNPRPFVSEDSGLPGVPDGLTVDSAGFVWSARWGGSCLVRHRPDGTVDRLLEIPSTQPTSCVFGGRDLNTLFVTTASYGMRDPGEYDGAVLAFDLDVVGRPAYKFRRLV